MAIESGELRRLEVELARAEKEMEAYQRSKGFSWKSPNFMMTVAYVAMAIGSALSGDWLMAVVWAGLLAFLPFLNRASVPLERQLASKVAERRGAVEEAVASMPEARPLSPEGRAELLPERTGFLGDSRPTVLALVGAMVLLAFLATRFSGADQMVAAWMAGLAAVGAGLGGAVAAFRAHIRQVRDSGTDFALKRIGRVSGDESSDSPSP